MHHQGRKGEGRVSLAIGIPLLGVWKSDDRGWRERWLWALNQVEDGVCKNSLLLSDLICDDDENRQGLWVFQQLQTWERGPRKEEGGEGMLKMELCTPNLHIEILPPPIPPNKTRVGVTVFKEAMN